MKRATTIVFVVALVLVSYFTGCEQKPPIVAPLPDRAVDTAYVEINPPFTGFNQPQGMMVGADQLIYVADTKNNRVVMLNRAGQVLSQRTIMEPLCLGQDSRLDLLVGGLMVARNGDHVAAIFRIHLVDASHHMDQALVDTVWVELARPARRFTGIAVFGDNTYLVVRDGPDNSSFVDPDARVLQFDNHDHFITPLAALTTRTGSGISDMYHPTGIAIFPGTRNFILTQSAAQNSYGALWFVYQSNADFVGWLPKFDPSSVQDRGTDFIRPNRFSLPSAVAIDRSRSDVFIADAALDSVFKFNSRGAFKAESFGAYKTNGKMVKPTGLAFFNLMLYVLDGDSSRGLIRRYQLTTDINR